MSKKIIKILATILIFSFNLSPILNISKTFAYYSDTETSLENTFQAGALDFHLEVGEWLPEENAVNLQPGSSVTTTISVIKDGSLDFVYSASTSIDAENSDTQFCNALNLKVELATSTLYNGPLSSLSFSSFSPVLISDGKDDLTFTLTLSSSYSPPEDGASCIFTFIFRGWQENLSFGQGFYDEEEIENEIRNGGSTTSGYSPIADSYVNEEKKNDNYGNAGELQIRSQNNKNKRTFIKFDFNFPSGTNILSSNLKLYMKSAPSTSRNYEIRRVLNDWKEKDPNGIDWNNQPSVSTSLTSSTSSGTAKNVWLSWNVTSDVQSFVSGSSTNYGWMIKDSNEDSSTAYEAKFHSRESNSIELRPILEVQFSAPEATTDHLVINEVYYHVGTGKGKEPDNEWVEIYNPTDSPFDISGWKICDNNSCDTIPTSTIPAKGFAVITNKSSTWDKWSIPDEAVKIVLNSAIGNGLANDGDRVELKKADNTLVDAMSYGNDKTYFELPLSGKGKSLARIIKGYDTNSATDWIINATPNPGTNPSVDGVETLIFTSYGVAVAGYEPVIEENDSGEEEIFEEEPIIEENSATTTEATTTGGIIDEISTTTITSTTTIETQIDTQNASTTPDIAENQPVENTDETPVVKEQPVNVPQENDSLGQGLSIDNSGNDLNNNSSEQ
jgi:predicted ribosomally synthesized peptide with SipW-like signal peptide